jgi:hypothetical protein
VGVGSSSPVVGARRRGRLPRRSTVAARAVYRQGRLGKKEWGSILKKIFCF